MLHIRERAFRETSLFACDDDDNNYNDDDQHVGCDCCWRCGSERAFDRADGERYVRICVCMSMCLNRGNSGCVHRVGIV